MALRRRWASRRESMFMAATWPLAWTPVSVREDPRTVTGWEAMVSGGFFDFSALERC